MTSSKGIAREESFLALTFLAFLQRLARIELSFCQSSPAFVLPSNRDPSLMTEGRTAGSHRRGRKKGVMGRPD